MQPNYPNDYVLSRDNRLIYKHIEFNKGDDEIPSERCIEAIRMIQKAVEDSQ